MKLASLRDGSRDGQLVVVSTDLSMAHHASGIATRLRQVLDDWNFLSPQLEDLYRSLSLGKARHAFPFDPSQCMAPLPRAGRWVRCSGDPAGGTLHDAAPDDFLGPCQPVPPAPEGLQAALRLALVTGEVPAAALPAQAVEGARLLALACEWRTLSGALEEPGLRDVSFAPVAVTPDELGDAWTGAIPVWAVRINDAACGRPEGGSAPGWADAGAWLSRLAAQRRVRSATVLGLPSAVLSAAAAGGEPALRAGDTLSAALSVRGGPSVFGALTQAVVGAAAD